MLFNEFRSRFFLLLLIRKTEQPNFFRLNDFFRIFIKINFTKAIMKIYYKVSIKFIRLSFFHNHFAAETNLQYSDKKAYHKMITTKAFQPPSYLHNDGKCTK